MPKVYARTFVWRFDQPPEVMWQALADTARFNEAAGLPKHAIEEIAEPDGSMRFIGRARKAIFELEWEEVPVEWVDQDWFRHLRVFNKGPIATICATLRLESDDQGGSIGHYLLEASPANLLGRFILATGFFPAAKKTFTKLAYSARDWAAGERETVFEPPPPSLPRGARDRAATLVDRIEATPNGHGLARRLASWLMAAQEFDLMRIRPLVLAERWGEDDRHVIECCLQAVREGMLELRWDLLCPRCRGAKFTATSLDRIPQGAHCTSCNIEYDRDFAENVELTFHPAPTVREVIDGEFCLFGPMTTPHVKVQVSVEGGESREIEARIRPGDYRLRTLEIGGEQMLSYGGNNLPQVTADGGNVSVVDGDEPGKMSFINREARRRTFIVESREWVHDALIAHRVTTMQSFRDLFGEDVLRPGDEVGISQIALLFTDLRNSTEFYERVGDAPAYHLVREHFALLAGICRRHNGAIVKTIGDAVMGAFADPADAMRAAIDIQAEIKDFNAQSGIEPIVVKAGVHAGPCISVTLNERLDYFGGTVNMASRLQGQSQGDDIVISRQLAADPAVAAVLADYDLETNTSEIRGFNDAVTFYRLTPDALKAGRDNSH